MSSATVNPFEVAGRLTKAYRIAQLLHRTRITFEVAQLQSPEEWKTTAMCAGYDHASEKTIALAIEKLAGMENFPN